MRADEKDASLLPHNGGALGTLGAGVAKVPEFAFFVCVLFVVIWGMTQAFRQNDIAWNIATFLVALFSISCAVYVIKIVRGIDFARSLDNQTQDINRLDMHIHEACILITRLSHGKKSFSESEFDKIYHKMISDVEREFCAVNYLSSTTWAEKKMSMLLYKVKGQYLYKGNVLRARRVFVINSEAEIDGFKDIFRLHIDCNVTPYYVLLSKVKSHLSGKGNSVETFIICDQEIGIYHFENGGRNVTIDYSFDERVIRDYTRKFDDIVSLSTQVT